LDYLTHKGHRLKNITICVDFDGTIVDHVYPNIGQPVPGAIDWLKDFQQRGARIILWTMRSHQSLHGDMLTPAINYLKNNGIDIYAANINPSQSSWTNSPKAYAQFYIDDAAIGCPLIEIGGFSRKCVDWKKIGKLVNKRLNEK